MLARHLAPAAVLAAVLLQSGCAAPHASPEAIQRLDPAALAGIESARQPARPSASTRWSPGPAPGSPAPPSSTRSADRHPPSDQPVRGGAPEGPGRGAGGPRRLDEAHQRWARDEAAAARARRDAEQAAALKRAQADAERYRRSVPYADPFWPYRSYPFGYPYPHPRFAPYGGFGWGIQIRP